MLDLNDVFTEVSEDIEPGLDLPNALVAIWMSRGYLFQVEYDLNSEESVNGLVCWWFQYGQHEYPKVKNHINEFLIHRHHVIDFDGVENLQEIPVTPLMRALLSTNNQFVELITRNTVDDRKFLWRWWFDYGKSSFSVEPFIYPVNSLEVPGVEPGGLADAVDYYDRLVDFICNVNTSLSSYDAHRSNDNGMKVLSELCSLYAMSSQVESGACARQFLIYDWDKCEFVSEFVRYAFSLIGVNDHNVDYRLEWNENLMFSIAHHFIPMLSSSNFARLYENNNSKDWGFELSLYKLILSVRPDLKSQCKHDDHTCLKYFYEWLLVHGINEITSLGFAMKKMYVGNQERLKTFVYLYENYDLEFSGGSVVTTFDGSPGVVHEWWVATGKEKYADLVHDILTAFNQGSETATRRINIFGYANGDFGIGEDARLLGKSLSSNNYEVFHYRPVGEIGPRESGYVPEVSVEEFSATHGEINIFCMPAFATMHMFASSMPHFSHDSYNIGIWQWETNSWPAKCVLPFRFVDELWAISSFVADAIKKVFDNDVLVYPNMVEIPQSNEKLDPDFYLPQQRDNAFVFGTVFDGASFIARKNPMATVEAFQRAFIKQENVYLVIKVMNAQDSSLWREILRRSFADKRILIINEQYTKLQLYTMLASFDCFVSLHRSEGFGRLIAESMLLETPVIVSDYSGSKDFCTEDTVELVPGVEIPLMCRDYPFWEGQNWFEPDIAIASEKMRQVYEDYDSARIKSKAGKLLVSSNYSSESVVNFVSQRLSKLTK